jgi:hypothetical protein
VSTLRSAAAPPSSSLLSLISWAPSLDLLATSCSGLRGEGRGDLGDWDFFGRMKAERGFIWGFWRLLADCSLKVQFLLGVTAGLNNQRLGTVLLF